MIGSYSTTRKLSWVYLTPFMIIAVFLPLIMGPGGKIYNHFQSRQFVQHFPEFEKVVHELQQGTIQRSSNSFYATPDDLPSKGAHIEQNEGGILIVQFFTGGPTPFSTGGYIYISNDRPENSKYLKSTAHKFKPCWYQW